MHRSADNDIAACQAAIAALEGQRDTLGDAVVELATAPLRARLASLQRPGGLQHRQVTVLFADVVGSTAMAQALDAEDTLALLNEAMRRMATLIDAHKGRVLRFTGDGIKAAFGMDAAREDDAERAVRAGLAIQQSGLDQAEAARRRLGIADFAVRVGVHTGDVALGAGIDADNTAMGAAVNIAARMEQSAPPGTLRISHDTWSLVRGLFDCEAQPPLQVKGVDAPMSTYLVRAARERSVAHVERGLQGLATPMVGRDAELQQLLDAVTCARETRQLKALTLVGDAGLGKSRLLRELNARLTGCRVLSLRCQPDGRLRPWGLLHSLLAVQCGVADNDSAEAAGRKVVDGLSPWFEAHGERQAQLIGQLSGLDFGDSPQLRGLDPRLLRDQALLALRRYLQALAAKGDALPVLVAEDLHWADDGSLDLLQHLQSHAAELPLALIMTCRPVLLTQRPGWGPPETLLRLEPLAAVHGDQLLAALLQAVVPVPAKLTALIAERAEGNPYYMEELVRRLIDDGVIVPGAPHWTVHAERLDSVRLPGTLVGLLQARLDALPTDERQAARHASIVGHVFWDDALKALDPDAPKALPALQRASVVKSHQTSDFEGTTERAFDHHLLHQVTYDSLLKAEQRLGHGAAARWLAERTQGRGGQFLALTGEHAERAGDTALAIDCFQRAGREAQLRYANAAASAWLQRALQLLGESDPWRRFDILRWRYNVADVTGDRTTQDATAADMAACLERRPDDERQAQLWFDTALLADRRSDTATAERLCQQALDLAEHCGAAQTAALCHGLQAWFEIARSNPAGAPARVEKGLRWAGSVAAADQRGKIEIQLLMVSAIALHRLNRLDEARACLQTGLERAQALGGVIDQINATSYLSEIAAALGQWDEMTRLAVRMHDLARAIDSRLQVALAHRLLGRAAAAQGQHAVAIDWHGQARAGFLATGDRRYLARSQLSLGEAQLALGQPQAALAWQGQAHELAMSLDDRHLTCDALALAARCEAVLGRTDAALARANETLERFAADLAGLPPKETIDLRWQCQQVFAALGDPRAAPLLEALHADVQAQVTALTGPDAKARDRLIQDEPRFREIVAAHRRAAPGAGAVRAGGR